MASINDGLVDSPFGRVRPEILSILNGGQGSPAPVQQEAPVSLDAFRTPQQAAAPSASVDPNSFGSAVGRGVDTMQANVGGTVEDFGEITGSQFLQDSGKQIRDEQMAEAAQYGQPEVDSYKDVDFNDLSTVSNYLSNTVGAMAPQLGTTMAAMGAGAVAGEKAGAPFGIPGRVAGPIIGGFLASFGINTGALQNEIKALDPNKQAPWTSVAFGAGAGVLDTLGVKSLVSPLLKHIAPEIIYQNAVAAGIPKVMALDGIKAALAGGAKGAATEGAISAGTEVGQGYLAAKVTDHELDTDALLERGINAAIGGTVGGATARAGSQILDNVMSNAHAAGTAVPAARFADGTTEEGGFLTKVWQMGGREATAPLEPLARVAPEAENFIRQFRPDATGEKATGKTVFEDYELRSGKWNSEVTDIFRGKSDAQKDAIIAEASLPRAQVTDPSAIRLRDVLDQAPADAKKSGLNVGYLEGYMPFRPDVAKIESNRPQFEAEIAPYIADPAAAVDNYIQTMNTPRENNAPQVTRLVQQDPATGKWVAMKQQQKKGDPETLRGKFAQGTVPPKFSHLEFSRAFNEVPQSIMNKYAAEETPAQKVQAVHDYFHGAAHRIAFTDRFGETGEKANKQIATAVAQAQKKGRNVSKAEVDQMYGILDAYNGMYGRIQSDSLRNAQSATAAFLTIKSLPLAVLSSLVEFTTPAIRGNVVDALTSVIPTFAQLAKNAAETLFKGSPRSDWAKMAADTGIDLASTQNVLAERLGSTLFNRGSATAMKYFFLANGLTLLTHSQRVYAAKTGERIYNDAIYKLSLGIDLTSAKGAQLQRQLRTMGLEINSQGEAMAHYAPSNPSEVQQAREAKLLAVRRFTSQTILEPNSADLPLWMNNGHMQLLAQLKRYPTAYTNIILPQLVRKMRPSYQGSYTGAAAGAVGIAFILGAMLGIGYIQDELKQWTKAGLQDPEDQRTEGQRFMDVASSTVLPMQMQYVTNMFNADRYGTDPVAANLGPAAGLIKEAVQAGSRTVSSFEEEPTSGFIWQFLYKQTPVINVLKPGKEAVKEYFDLP